MSVDFRILRESAHVDVEWAVIEPLWAELRTPYEPDDRLTLVTWGQRAVYALTWIRDEVANGGFHQCFSNPTGLLLPEAVEGANTLRSPEWGDVLRRARDLFPPPYPRDWTRRQQLLARLPPPRLDAIDRLDEELFDLESMKETRLDGLFRRYIEQHPQEFFVPAPDEETAAAALVASARSIVNGDPPRRLELAAQLLREAVTRSRDGGSGKAAGVAESVLAQLSGPIR